jgi:predicted nucleic acid-binding protein
LTTLAYVDASAITKLVVDEPGSAAMRRWYIESERVITSRVGVIETLRAVRRVPHDADHLDKVLRSFEVLELDGSIARAAALVQPTELKSLDSIHLASALALVPEIEAFVTYDARLAAAARSAGLAVILPA